MAYDYSDERAQGGLVQRMRRYLYNDLVNSYREELDHLTAQAHQQIKEEIERTLDLAVAHTEERVSLIIDELARPFRSREQKAMEDFSDGLVRQRSAQFEATVQALLQDAGQRLAKANALAGQDADRAVERARSACDAEGEKSSAAIAQAGSIVSVMLEEGAARLKELAATLGSDAEQAAAGHRARLDAVAAPALDDFRRNADAILSGVRAQAEASLHSTLDRAGAEFGGRLEQRAQELLAQCAAQFQQKASEAGDTLRQQIQAAVTAVTEQNERRAESMAAALKRNADEAVEAFRQGLERTLREHAETGARDLEARFEEVERRHFAAIRDQLAKEMEEFGSRAIADAKARLDQASREVCDTVYQEIGTATVALQRLSQQAEARFDGIASRSFNALNAKIESTTDASLVELKKGAGVVAENTRDRLLRAAAALEVAAPADPEELKAPAAPRAEASESPRPAAPPGVAKTGAGQF